MNKLILILVSSIIFAINSDNDDKTFVFFSSPFEKLSGHVKQIIEVSTDHIGNPGVVKEPNRVTADFDNKGNMVQVWIAPDIITKFNTNYDSNGKRLTSIGTFLAGQQIFQFDNNEHIVKSISKTVLDKESAGLVAQYEYDGNDDVVEADILDSFGKVSFKYIFTYDEKHHLRTQALVAKGFPALKTHYEYLSFDQKRNWIKKIKILELGTAAKSQLLKDTITRKITYY